MRETKFIETRRQDWQRLDTLVTRLNRKGAGSLTEEELGEVAALYRKATADLAYVQTHFPYSRNISYLNALVQRAHAAIYRGEPLTARQFVRFFTHVFPAAVRQANLFVVVATTVFLLGAILGGWAVATENSFWLDLLPHEFLSLLEEGENLGPGEEFTPQESPIFTALITTNNIQVSFLAFALGVTLGIGTLWILFFNGMLIGAVAWIFYTQDRAAAFWGWVAPHGALELPVIFIAGAAGLMIGKALVQPGDFRRKDALKLAARSSIPLIGGCIVLLIVAGIIEGFYSPLALPHFVKHATGAGLFVLFGWYVTRSGLQHNNRNRTKRLLSPSMPNTY